MKNSLKIEEEFRALNGSEFSKYSSRASLLALEDEDFYRFFKCINSYLSSYGYEALIASEMLLKRKGSPRLLIHLPEILEVEPHQEAVGRALYETITSFKGMLGVRGFYKELYKATRSKWFYIDLASKFLLDAKIIQVE